MSATGADSTGSGKTFPTEAPQVSTVVQFATAESSVPVNIFTGTLQDIIGFTNTQVQILVDNGFYNQESVMYWKFTNIKEWCQLKSKIPASCGEVNYENRKIECLQSLDCCLTGFMLRGKIIDLNSFKTDILSDAIEKSQIDF